MIMKFTDNDLARLREALRDGDFLGGTLDAVETDALLARLEAAEKVCEAAQHMKRLAYSARFNAAMEAWREKAGK